MQRQRWYARCKQNRHMNTRIEGFAMGLVGGAVGLMAMSLAKRLLAPIVRGRERTPTDVFLRQRSMSLIGPQHRPGEPATEAVARVLYTRATGVPPSDSTRRRVGQVVHVGVGMLAGGVYGAATAPPRDPLRRGAALGAILWAGLDELAVPLLGLADRPTAYPPGSHLQALAAHLGYGVATATTVHAIHAIEARSQS